MRIWEEGVWTREEERQFVVQILRVEVRKLERLGRVSRGRVAGGAKNLAGLREAVNMVKAIPRDHPPYDHGPT